jgi:hypothetical protein
LRSVQWLQIELGKVVTLRDVTGEHGNDARSFAVRASKRALRRRSLDDRRDCK